jgi:hypothetical protein
MTASSDEFLSRVVIPAVCRLINAELKDTIGPLVRRIEALERRMDQRQVGPARAYSEAKE